MKQQRDSNIECLRVVLMFGVCLLHTIFLAAPHSRAGIAEWVAGLASGSVDGFVFISGYYGIRFSPHKAISLYILALLCALEGRLAGSFMEGGSIFAEVTLAFHDVARGYWFLHAYVALSFLAPMINVAFKSRADESVECFKSRVLQIGLPILFLTFGWSWIVTRAAIFNVRLPLVHGMDCCTWLTLLGVYCAAKIYRVFALEERLPKSLCWLCVLLLPIATGFQFYCLGGYQSPMTLMLVMAIFTLFKNIRIVPFKLVKLIKWLTPSLFAIYLLHQSPFGSASLRIVAGHLPASLHNVLGGFLLACVAFVVSAAVDLIRRSVKFAFVSRWTRNGDG